MPEDVRKTAGSADRNGRSPGREEDVKSVSWIIEVSSQVIFSTSAAVHYEVLLARDEKSLSLGFAPLITGGVAPAPGQVSDHQQSQGAKDGHHKAQPRGIYSKAIRLRVDDTASLWNTPKMPEWDDAGKERAGAKNKDAPVEKAMDDKEDKNSGHKPKRQKKVHLVVLTHGLHSNLGADMLFLKESIDASAKKVKAKAQERRAAEKREKQEAALRGRTKDDAEGGEASDAAANQLDEDGENSEDEEEIIVRGFSGNATRTERGIKYLGKRLAKYVLAMTYPDQPYRPVTKKTAAESLSHALKPEQSRSQDEGTPTHHHSTIEKEPYHDRKLPYKITSISFIAHSLGGLTQTYAVAYIQKHSPQFFDIIEPINFIAMATPFLGLSNENPLYVKFALDFGLVGRSGKDLGLTWRAPTIARSGWGAIVGGIGESASKKLEGETPPESKPLLRILPTGPAHVVLKKFRNRTVYSNVVNDGIVPLRTSCLLFLDWSGLGRVEKARRENGLVGTMAEWGWAEITGQNSSSPMRRTFSDTASSENEMGDNTPTRQGHGGEVPQPPPYATDEDDARSLKSTPDERPKSAISSSGEHNESSVPTPSSATSSNTGPLASLLGLFKPTASPKPHNYLPKHSKIYKRSQTLKVESNSSNPSISTQESSPQGQSKATAGDSDHEDFDRLSAPPKTTFFESAGDLLKPPLPPVDFLIDPASRPRTIFHDRVYHPEDIPPPPLKKRPTNSLSLRRRSSSNITTTSTPKSVAPPHTDSTLSSRDYDDTKNTNPDKDPHEVVDGSAMKVEEKIARAYHRDLSWRKVLVRLEPDAHNNMVVRRMFANAYGWPVINHLCDTHFGDSAAAKTRDDEESNRERAKEGNEAPDSIGGEVNESEDDTIQPIRRSDRTDSENREASDAVPALKTPRPGSLGKALSGQAINMKRPTIERAGTESEGWSERDWADSEVDSDEEDAKSEKRNSGEANKGWSWTEAIAGKGATNPKGTDKALIDEFLGNKKHERAHDEVDLQLVSDAAAARVLSGESAGVGVGLESALSKDKKAGVEGEHIRS